MVAADRSPSTSGNTAGVNMATPLLGAVAPAGRLVAGKARDADGMRRWPRVRRVEAARTVA